MIKKELTRDYLQEEYVNKARSAYSIAKEVGCSTKYVLKKVREFGFEVRARAHHIDYEKTNNVEGNLVSLCKSCHTKTNFNRDAWIAYFQKLLENVVHVAV